MDTKRPYPKRELSYHINARLDSKICGTTHPCTQCRLRCFYYLATRLLIGQWISDQKKKSPQGFDTIRVLTIFKILLRTALGEGIGAQIWVYEQIGSKSSPRVCCEIQAVSFPVPLKAQIHVYFFSTISSNGKCLS